MGIMWVTSPYLAWLLPLGLFTIVLLPKGPLHSLFVFIIFIPFSSTELIHGVYHRWGTYHKPGCLWRRHSNSIMEYMALAKPVIATNGGGTCEIVVDGVTGFLIEPHLTDTLTEKVEYLLNNKDTARSMGKAGGERVFNEFNLDRMTNNYLELYKKCGNGTQ